MNEITPIDKHIHILAAHKAKKLAWRNLSDLLILLFLWCLVLKLLMWLSSVLLANGGKILNLFFVGAAMSSMFPFCFIHLDNSGENYWFTTRIAFVHYFEQHHRQYLWEKKRFWMQWRWAWRPLRNVKRRVWPLWLFQHAWLSFMDKFILCPFLYYWTLLETRPSS